MVTGNLESPTLPLSANTPPPAHEDAPLIESIMAATSTAQQAGDALHLFE